MCASYHTHMPSYVCVICMRHMWTVEHSYVGVICVCHMYASYMCVICVRHMRTAVHGCVTSHICTAQHMCDVTHLYVRHESFIYVTDLIYVCDMTHSLCDMIRAYASAREGVSSAQCPPVGARQYQRGCEATHSYA